MTIPATGHATATLSGREIALRRRQAMAQHGKSAVVGNAAARLRTAAFAAADAKKLVAAHRAEPVAPASAAAAVSSVARARRQALAARGKAALPTLATAWAPQRTPAAAGCGCGDPCVCRTAAGGSAARPSAVGRAAAAMQPASSLAAAPGRQIAMQRRQALAQQGRAALQGAPSSRASGRVRARANAASPAPAARTGAVAASENSQRFAGASRITGTAAGRTIGSADDTAGAASRVTGARYLGLERLGVAAAKRTRSASTAAEAATLARGRPITGTQVDRSRKVTGLEHGADRPITGTRYSRPQPAEAPEKVAVTHTVSGETVTGTAVGRSPRVTGDEPGSCRPITGTQYLSAEQFRDLCRTQPPAVPRKVSVMSTPNELKVSGTAVDRSAKVTGNEIGSCRAVTGTPYFNTADFAALCEVPVPQKVGAMQTGGSNPVTGSLVGPSAKTTGEEAGACKPVTGTDYVGPDQLAAVCSPDRTPAVEPPAKVVVDTTLRGQPVTGAYPGRADNVTGNEAGACAPVTGTPYAGRSQYQAFCPAPSLEAQVARLPDSAVIPATVVTGDRPGAGGNRITGDERGACEPVTGAPYLGADNWPAQCATSGRFGTRGRSVEPLPRPPAPQDFSVVTPARQGRERRSYEVSGSTLSAERITGPINKASGLITGTPEFRHTAAARAEARPGQIAAAPRVSGEGSQQGRAITGDAWTSNAKVTGTEGSWSRTRNPSLRGQPRGAGVNAATFRDIERPEVPDSVVTGSAGNARKGATVTYSGGARG